MCDPSGDIGNRFTQSLNAAMAVKRLGSLIRPFHPSASWKSQGDDPNLGTHGLMFPAIDVTILAKRSLEPRKMNGKKRLVTVS